MNPLPTIRQKVIEANPSGFPENRPARLADVLVAQKEWWRKHALENGYITDAKDEDGLRETLLESDHFEGERTGILENWNLLDDDLDHQSPECLEFLSDLLK